MAQEVTEQSAVPYPTQPEVIYLNRGSARLPVGKSMLKTYTCDKIFFDCPVHPIAYDESGLVPLEDDSAKGGGRYSKGHRILLFAHAGKPYTFKQKIGKETRDIFIYGYEVEGTKITITPQVICNCSNMGHQELSEELLQETGEIYYRVVHNGYTENFVSSDPLTATVREVRV